MAETLESGQMQARRSGPRHHICVTFPISFATNG